MPPVGDLDSLRQGAGDSLAISAPTVTGVDLDRSILLQPRLRAGLLAVRQERYDAAALEIADESAVAVVDLQFDAPTTERQVCGTALVAALDAT